MSNEPKDLVHLSIEAAREALQRLVDGQDPTASKLSDRRDFADWELTYLLRTLIPVLPPDLQTEVQACYDLREQVWSDDYREAYYAQQKTSPSCLPASDSFQSKHSPLLSKQRASRLIVAWEPFASKHHQKGLSMQYMTETTLTFDTFYTRFLPQVQQLLGGVLRGECREYLEDVTQDTFVKAWKAFDQLDQVQNPRAWICVIARHAAYDFLRQRQARQRLDCPLLEEAAEFLPDSHPGAQAVYSGEAESIAHAFARLRPDDQQVMALLLQEYTRAEIAAVLHLDSEACRVRIRRARRRFQRHYVQA